jgi:dolichol kinase
MSGQDWLGVGMFFLYYIIGAGGAALLSLVLKLPQEVRRKIYHLLACGSIFVLLQCFDHWYGALAAIGLFLLVVFVVVPTAVRLFSFKAVAIQRGGSINEVLYQAGIFLLSQALLIGLFWGLFGEEHKLHIAIGMTALGLGDAAAALIGRHFGRKKFRSRIFDRSKTVEGSLAMIGSAFGGILLILLFLTELSFSTAFLSALILAVLSGAVEAVAVHGLDTILIPLAVSFFSHGLFLLIQ